MAKHTYVARTAPKLRIKVAREKIQFENSVFSTDDDAFAAAFDKLLADPKMTHLSALIEKIDYNRAEAIAKAHQQSMANYLGGSVTGSMSSASNMRSALSRAALEQRDQQLIREGASPEQVEKLHKEMAKDGLQLTEKSSEVVRNNDLKPDLTAKIDIDGDDSSEKSNPMSTVKLALSKDKK